MGQRKDQPISWPGPLKKIVREKSKILLELFLSVGQRMLYEPIGSERARTHRGWYLTKGEEVEVVNLSEIAQGKIEVMCVNLPGRPRAYICEQSTWVDLDEDGGDTQIWGLPLRYKDIVTVYSAQGSQYKKVCFHVQNCKGKRNLMYTAVSRAMEELSIQGLKDKHDLYEKMELHPKSVLWQEKLHPGSFSKVRLAEAARLVGNRAK